MPAVRVLVVDDSLTMRALFSGVLNEDPGITVLDHAANADEAREMIAKLRPDVVTLDVEMPGMSGLDFLREIMANKPLPVIMLSTLTQKGSAATLEALDVGAFECFPKPMTATMDEFRKIGPKLVKLVKAAAAGGAQRQHHAATAFVDSQYQPGDSLVALLGNTGAIPLMAPLIAGFPANCPPTLIHLPSAHGVIDALVEKLNAAAKPTVRAAADGLKIEPGTVTIIHDPATHGVIDRWPGASLRLLGNDPIAGCRPSANLLLASIAKTAGAAAAVGVLSGIGMDGVTSLAALAKAGGVALALNAEEAKAAELPQEAVAKADAKPVTLADLGRGVLMHRSPQSAAA